VIRAKAILTNNAQNAKRLPKMVSLIKRISCGAGKESIAV